MSTTVRSSKRCFCLMAVVMLALATVPSSAFALALRGQQERLPAELSLADAITIYLERNVDLPATRNRPEHIGASLAGDKDITPAESRLAEMQRRGIQNLFEARRSRREVRQKYFRTLLDYHLSLALLESAVGKNLSDAAR